MQFRFVPYGSGDYDRTVALRRRVLREPLGLEYSPADLAAEEAQTHIAAFEGPSSNPDACLILKEADANPGSVQLRQMAVAEDARRHGLGSAIVNFAESHARSQGKTHIFCHSRYYVIPFYRKLGYTITGEPFQEVGMTHVRMEKEL